MALCNKGNLSVVLPCAVGLRSLYRIIEEFLIFHLLILVRRSSYETSFSWKIFSQNVSHHCSFGTISIAKISTECTLRYKQLAQLEDKKSTSKTEIWRNIMTKEFAASLIVSMFIMITSYLLDLFQAKDTFL